MNKLCGFAITFCCWLAATTIVSLGQSDAGSLLIRGGRLVDGTGSPARIADIRVAGERIVAIGRLTPKKGERIIDAQGLVVAPGFIDIHNHSERGFADDPGARSQILQGITTIAVGPDGGSPWPIGEYLDWGRQQRLATNLLAFVG
ncbi:MAG: D-aminoacylase, partial [Acidobacteria bacterium]|nr:D-aminoacylase [Acidobacteriota bacterium]